MARFTRLNEVEGIIRRVRETMRARGITVSYLAKQLGVSRQYAWQVVHYRTPLSAERAAAIERLVETIVAERRHLATFGERLRAARLAAGLTLKQAADRIGYSWVGVERWEKNLCLPKPGVLWHLFAVYGTSADALQPLPAGAAWRAGRLPSAHIGRVAPPAHILAGGLLSSGVRAHSRFRDRAAAESELHPAPPPRR